MISPPAASDWANGGCSTATAVIGQIDGYEAGTGGMTASSSAWCRRAIVLGLYGPCGVAGQSPRESAAYKADLKARRNTSLFRRPIV
jgi:hypothetical protein